MVVTVRMKKTMFRWLIWQVTSAFCKHEWKLEENWSHTTDVYDRVIEKKLRVSATCTKCGWHRRYTKY